DVGELRLRVLDDGLDLLAEDATGLVDLVDRHQLDVLEGGLADGHGAGEGVEDADFNGVAAASALAAGAAPAAQAAGGQSLSRSEGQTGPAGPLQEAGAGQFGGRPVRRHFAQGRTSIWVRTMTLGEGGD